MHQGAVFNLQVSLPLKEAGSGQPHYATYPLLTLLSFPATALQAQTPGSPSFSEPAPSPCLYIPAAHAAPFFPVWLSHPLLLSLLP